MKEDHSEVIRKGERVAVYKETAGVNGKGSVRITSSMRKKRRNLSPPDGKRDKGEDVAGRSGPERFIM